MPRWTVALTPSRPPFPITSSLMTDRLSRTVFRHLRELQLSGLSTPIRYALSSFSLVNRSDLGCQPIQAFKNPKFEAMLDMASWATKGVTLPSPKKTRVCIIHMFKQSMYLLRDRLNVSTSCNVLSFFTPTSIHQGPTVTGQISVTCDAWKAGNADAYFAVTGHWVEEHAPGEWTLEHMLLGFVQMNCSHSGTCLGQMLYTVLNCLRIVHKVRHLCSY